MAGARQQEDLLEQIRKLQERVRRLETRRRPVTSQTKTFLVSGVVETGFQTPPFIVSTFPLYATDQEWERAYPQDRRVLTGVGGKLLDGECWCDFYVNETAVYEDLHVTAAQRTFWQPISWSLDDNDLLSVTVASANDAARDLSAAFVMTLESWD